MAQWCRHGARPRGASGGAQDPLLVGRVAGGRRRRRLLRQAELPRPGLRSGLDAGDRRPVPSAWSPSRRSTRPGLPADARPGPGHAASRSATTWSRGSRSPARGPCCSASWSSTSATSSGRAAPGSGPPRRRRTSRPGPSSTPRCPSVTAATSTPRVRPHCARLLPEVERWADQVLALGLPLTPQPQRPARAQRVRGRRRLAVLRLRRRRLSEPLSVLLTTLRVLRDVLDCAADDPRLSPPSAMPRSRCGATSLPSPRCGPRSPPRCSSARSPARSRGRAAGPRDRRGGRAGRGLRDRLAARALRASAPGVRWLRLTPRAPACRCRRCSRPWGWRPRS